MLIDGIKKGRAKVIVTDPYTSQEIRALLPSEKYSYYTNVYEYSIYVNTNR